MSVDGQRADGKNANTQPAWRAVAIAAAKEQAAQEGRHTWQRYIEHLGAGEPLPFDYRYEHVAQVTALALHLGRILEADLEIIEAAGWLHDVRKQEPSHGIAGAAAACAILAATDFPLAKIDAVAEAIRQHAGLYRKPGAPPLEPVEAAILWDADKLTKLGAQSIMVSLSTAHVFGKDMAERWRYVAEFADNILSKTVESMNTTPGRKMAERRYQSMLAVLNLWAREMCEAGVELQGELNFEISFDHDGLSKK